MRKFRIHHSAFIVAFLSLCLCVSVATPAWAVKPVNIYTRNLTAGQNGVAYSATVKAKFGTKPYTWSIGSGALPTGLSIAGATGIISGTPTVNNTFNFVVHVVDSAGAPTTDDQSLYIVITGAAPAPSPAVSITTTSVPDGVVGGAYSTTLQATGGTAPYTWSVPASCVAPSCTLPPATSLASTGIISGTLTAAGTYSFTARVTDSSPTPQTADRAFAATIAAGGAYLFSDDLSSFAAWTAVTSSGSSVACPGGGTCAQWTYVLCGDSSDPACGAANQDVGGYTYKILAAQDHFFMRGYFRFHVNAGGTPLAGIGRKLFYLLDPTDTHHSVAATTIGESTGLQYRAFGFTPGSKGGTFCGLDTISTRTAAQCGTLAGSSRTTVQYYWVEDAWYYIEVEVKLNTPAAAGPYDGEGRVWIQKIGVDPAPILVMEATGVNYRTALTTGITRFYVGMQTNRQNYQDIDEIRNWKDIAISTTGPIGP